MIAYDFMDTGREQNMVLVHGFTQNRRLFDKQISCFSDRFNLVLVDLRGHGESAHNGPFGLEEYTDDLEEVLDYLKLETLIYWGTHTGTAIALNLYFRNPGRFAALILEGTVIPGYPTPGIKKNIERAAAAAKEQGLEQGRKVWLEQSEWFAYMNRNPEKTRRNAQESLLNSFEGNPWLSPGKPRQAPDLRSRLPELDIPVLAYNGAEDMPEFLEMAEVLRKNPKVDYEIVPKAGGFPLWENPDTVNALVGNWLAKHTDREVRNE